MTEGTSATRVAAKQPAAPVLTVSDGWKTFGHVTALSGISLTARAGEVLALVGDNGAGKSTLVKVLAGVHSLDAGELRIGGVAVNHADPKLSRQRGVSTVFQDLALVETLDVAANIFLGQPIRRWRILANRSRMIEESAATLRDLKIRVPSVRVPVGELSGGQRQGVAIARAVRQDTPIVLMDEPTAALGVRETSQVGDIIGRLRSSDKAVILVTHDMEFVFAFADRIQVLRLGRVQGVRVVGETTRDEVIALITGAASPDDAEASGEH